MQQTGTKVEKNPTFIIIQGQAGGRKGEDASLVTLVLHLESPWEERMPSDFVFWLLHSLWYTLMSVNACKKLKILILNPSSASIANTYYVTLKLWLVMRTSPLNDDRYDDSV